MKSLINVNLISYINGYLQKKKYSSLFLFLLSVSSSSIIYFYLKNEILIYNDSRSHLNISRRIIDNLTPGLAQLGGTWLPLYHLLVLPFIWNNFLYHSGLAGSIVSGIAYIGASIYIFKILEQFVKSKIALLG